MKYPVRLFLGNEEVEFSTPPAVLFNYNVTELTNPSIVRNSFSKTLTIEGTAQNNKIFGHFYNLERIQGYDGTTVGTSFNPLLKTDFTLYYNGSIYESGYFKLDSIKKNRNNVEYNISLFGGLGDYFANLSYREDGTPLELSDLTFRTESAGNELGFQINKEAVAEAWNYIYQPSSKWDTINFAPCYNGIPENFSADKVLINNSGITDYQSILNPQDYSMGTTSEALTEWEAFDLRSYLQRPVVRVREVIDAVCNPSNNGGYEVELDPDFFNTNNPHYWDSWMTLPMLNSLDVPAATPYSALPITALTKEGNYLYGAYSQTLPENTKFLMDLKIKYTPEDSSFAGDSLYMIRDYKASGGITLQTRFAKEYAYEDTLLLQLLAYNASGQIVADSPLFYLFGQRDGSFHFQTSQPWMSGTFANLDPKTADSKDDVVRCEGKFTRKNGSYYFTDMDGNDYVLRLSLPYRAAFSSIKVKIVPYVREYIERTGINGNITTNRDAIDITLWSQQKHRSGSWQNVSTVKNLARVEGTVSYEVVGASAQTLSYDEFYSYRNYTKKDLLTLGVTPAQFLLSYAKMFGLYFVKDSESKKITILSRHNFYQRDNRVNINDLIAKNEDITITPVAPQFQYYDFGLEQIPSEAAKSYSETYGSEYGMQQVNTGFQFEETHKKVLEDNIFKGGIDVLEKDKYFVKPVWDSMSADTYNGPAYVNNGFKYWYYTSGTTTEEHTKDTKPISGETINPGGLPYYDVFPKAQFHEAENKAVDGSMVLLFSNRGKQDATDLGYHLTDDTEEMYSMNSQSPCWIMTKGEYDKIGNHIALTVNSIPKFQRNIYREKYINSSLDFGVPQATFVPNIYVGEWQGIYSRGWRSFISDLYGVNTRVLKCKCLLRERPNPEWLRRFYWFDNCYWRLNVIKDWNISSFDTTEMEFIKVQDIADYDNVQFTDKPIVEFIPEGASVAYSGGTVTVTVRVSDGSPLVAADTWSVNYSDETTGYIEPYEITDTLRVDDVTEAEIVFNIPENESGYSRTINCGYEDNDDIFHFFTITQEGNPAPGMATISPTAIAVTSGSSTFTLQVTDIDEHGWYLSPEEAWLSPSRSVGTGSTSLTVEVEANDRQTERSGYILFSDATSTAETQVYVVQAAAAPVFTEIYANFAEGTFTTSIYDNYDLSWEVRRDYSGGTVIMSDSLGYPARRGELVYWGTNSVDDMIGEEDFGTIISYWYKLEIIDDASGNVLHTITDSVDFEVPARPTEEYYTVDLPNINL